MEAELKSPILTIKNPMPLSLAPPALPEGKLASKSPSTQPPTFWTTVKQNAPVYWHAFVCFARTPSGAFATFMMFMFVFWGAFLFLLLVNWVDFGEQQGLWVEITSQVENGFFSIMGIGLFPQRIWVTVCAFQLWRHRADADPAEIASWAARIKRQYAWYNMEDTPTRRAFPVRTFGLALYLYMFHSCLQCCISGIMWGFTRFNRPSAAIGVLIPISFIAIFAAEAIIALQGRKLTIVPGSEDEENVEVVFEENGAKFSRGTNCYQDGGQ
ncbi:hypothetical protein BC936DRAFT_149080 [Jimgerdemannia flammicorona]|uniref:Uncharacterized protein n=1 Tax=Jimgerdemannia flammicorona TaxID=994334 RepID=A0A433DK53_9FUNG|nr:hypothetical protein BC936DRAFT_149080 [Jimgerdemannia flammicorona]